MPDQTVHLAVDMMSGDYGLRLTVPAALQALSDYPQIFLHLVGEQTPLNTALANWPDEMRARTQICHAPALLCSTDKPTSVLRCTESSSVHACFAALTAGKVIGVISAGHAGMLMVLGKKIVGMATGFTRPALCAHFPTARGFSLVLDLGANVDCSAAQLYDFALLGVALFSSLQPSITPRVGLLSNGEEPGKGNAAVRQAAELLRANATMNYGGYVEASALHSGHCDVVVCDGFVGNIALKAVEGTAELAQRKLAGLLSDREAYGLSASDAEALFKHFSSHLNPESHNGAFLLGLDGIVIKAHGNSTAFGFSASIGCALECANQNMIARMKKQLLSADGKLN